MTELIWDGKYRDGKRVAPVRLALPFQTVETVNEGAADRHKALDLFARGQSSEWRNRLIWGDKKYVLPSLLPELAGKVNLIYIDPPFDTGADFSFTAEIPDSDESFVKEPSILEMKAYRDTWGRGLDSWLEWFYSAIVLLRELLAETGSIYVHLDHHIGHYAKAVLDEVFTVSCFLNEVVWAYEDIGGRATGFFKRKHDTLLVYKKGGGTPSTFCERNSLKALSSATSRTSTTLEGSRIGASRRPTRECLPNSRASGISTKSGSAGTAVPRLMTGG